MARQRQLRLLSSLCCRCPRRWLGRAAGGPSGLRPQHIRDSLVPGWRDEVERQLTEVINFEDFIKLYVNHRPVFGIGKEHIQTAFGGLGAEPPTKKKQFKKLIIKLPP